MNKGETGYRNLISPGLARAVAAVLQTFPGARLVRVAPNPRPGEFRVELEGENANGPWRESLDQAKPAASLVDTGTNPVPQLPRAPEQGQLLNSVRRMKS